MQQLQNCLFDKDLILQSDGSLYIGQFLHQHLEGYSLIINPDGSYYYGLFKESIPKDIGVYKLKNSCLKLYWDDHGAIVKVEDIQNVGFLSKVIQFKNNTYGNKILIKLNPLCYGVSKNGKFEGFTIMHYKNGDIYYGNIFKGKQDGEGIMYNNYHQEWYWNKYQHGKLLSHSLFGKNLVPRELIIKIFNKIQFKTQQITMVSLSHIQQLIINQLLLNNEQNHLSLTTTILSMNPIHRENLSQILNDELEINNNNNQELEICQDSKNVSYEEELQIYNQKQQYEEINNNLTKCETEKAINRIEKSRNNKFHTQTSQSKSPKNLNLSYTPKKIQKLGPKLIIKRQISPAFSTIRHLFSVIRI